MKLGAVTSAQVEAGSIEEARVRELSAPLKAWLKANIDKVIELAAEYRAGRKSLDKPVRIDEIDTLTGSVPLYFDRLKNANGQFRLGMMLIDPYKVDNRRSLLRVMTHELRHAEDPQSEIGGSTGPATKTDGLLLKLAMAGATPEQISKTTGAPLERARAFVHKYGKDKSNTPGATYFGNSPEINAYVGEIADDLKELAQTPEGRKQALEWLRSGMKTRPPVEVEWWDELKKAWESDPVAFRRIKTMLANAVLDDGTREVTATPDKRIRRGDTITWATGQYKDIKRTGKIEGFEDGHYLVTMPGNHHTWNVDPEEVTSITPARERQTIGAKYTPAQPAKKTRAAQTNGGYKLAALHQPPATPQKTAPQPTKPQEVEPGFVITTKKDIHKLRRHQLYLSQNGKRKFRIMNTPDEWFPNEYQPKASTVAVWDDKKQDWHNYRYDPAQPVRWSELEGAKLIGHDRRNDFGE